MPRSIVSQSCISLSGLRPFSRMTSRSVFRRLSLRNDDAVRLGVGGGV